MRAPSRLLLLLLTIVLGGCAHRVKSSNRVYEGDGPGMHMTERQRVGGPVNP